MKTTSDNMIAKIEGHGSLAIDFKAKKVELNILEGERLFEAMLIGRNFEQTYWITPRICGVCPIVHALASVKAVEDAFRIQISYSSQIMRELIMCAQMLESHILHLVFLSLPDYLGVDRGTEIYQKHPKYFNMALKIKKTADFIAKAIGGRPVHPVTITAGGFFKFPKIEVIKEIKAQLQAIVDDTEGLVNLGLSLKYPSLYNPCEYLSAEPKMADEFPIYSFSKISSSRNTNFAIANYLDEIKELVIPYSTAKFAKHYEQGFMVGALARVLLFSDRLTPLASQYLNKINLDTLRFNPYYNNFAQALEVLHYTEKAIIICDFALKNGLEKPMVGFKVRAGRGVGVMEAPRGTLYHDYSFDKKGNATNINIITPTVQNLAHIEEDANFIIEHSNASHAEIYHQIEMRVRAYDPCNTSSVH